MPDPTDLIHVVVALDFNDAILDQLRAISPRLKIERHFPDVPARAWNDVEVLYTLKTLPDPAQVPHLRWVQLHTAGVDHILDHPLYAAQDVEITTTSGIHAVPLSEYCLGMMLAFNLKLPRMLRDQAAAAWPANQHSIYAPRELRGQTVGIVGYGSIGRELARLCDQLGMRVLAVKRDVKNPADREAYREPGTGDPEGEIPTRIYPPEALASMAPECDFLVVLAPLTAKSRHLIDEAVLKAMKRTAMLINVARGPVVDEAALITALSAGRIAGAALDVFEEEPLPPGSPLWNLDNVIISPHVAGNSQRYHEKAAAVFAENLARYLDKRPLLNRVRRELGY
ncbi:MAG: D-2-hydroxyacid dehydrogenase [Candidatus Flexifilum sp.]|jgi:phosphoglycerate dehydrogenase-like enzyme